MRSILFLSNKNGLARFAPDLDLDFLKALHTRFQGPGWHIHIVKDTVEQDFDWLKTAAPYFGKVVHVVHHKLPRPEILNGLLVRIAETSDAGTRLAPFDGMHEKLPENLRCLPYLKLARMLPALQSGSIDDELLNDFEELWQLLDRHNHQVQVIGAYREALASYNTSTPSKPLVSDAPLKLIGFPSEDAIRQLVGDDVALCSLQDAEVRNGDRLVVLCETEEDENGKKVSPQQLAGVEWVKKKRRDGMRNPVLFVSTLGRKDLLENRPEFEILTALKHPFLKLDGGRIGQLGMDITKGLSKAGELDPLELEFVKQAYCSAVGLVQTMVHELYSVPEGDEFKRRAARVREDAYRLLEQGGRAPAPPKDWDKDRMAALDFIRGECNKLIAKQPNAQRSVKQEADVGWELLLLDDDIKAHSTSKNPHPFVRELEKERNLKVHLAGSSREARDKITADRASGRNQILLAVVDYHLRELQKDEVIGDQSEQGFHFVRHLSNEAEYVKPVVLTAMPRRFVMDSLRHLGVGLGSVFSKLDYFKEGNYSLLADQIVELGNENAEAVARLHMIGTTEWSKYSPYYLAHRRSPEYAELERFISEQAQLYCEGLQRGSRPFALDDYNSPLIPIKYVLPRDEEAMPSGYRPVDPKLMTKFVNRMICRRVAIWCALRGPTTITSALEINNQVLADNAKEENAKQRFNRNLALAFTSLPWCTTIEERNWLICEMNLGSIRYRETHERPVIGFAVGLVREWLRANSVVLPREDSTQWGSLVDVRRWLIKIELHHGGKAITDDGIEELISQCLTQANKYLSYRGTPIESIHKFARQLTSLRRKIQSRKRTPSTTPLNANKPSAFEEAASTAVKKLVRRRLGRDVEHEEIWSACWELVLEWRQKGELPLAEAVKQMWEKYKIEEGLLTEDKEYVRYDDRIDHDTDIDGDTAS